MRYEIKAPSELKSDIVLPASKSISNRALMISSLAEGKRELTNISDCDDTKVMEAALTDMPHLIDVGAAGTAMRFMTALLSISVGEHILTGTERMKHRPIGILVKTLRHLGADIEYTEQEGFPPLKINGEMLEGGSIDIEGNVSSQYISALLMIGPMMKHGLKLRLTGYIISKSYIDLTMDIMRTFGAEVEWTGIDTIQISSGKYHNIPFHIENDWSAASYWYEIMALCDDPNAEVRLQGLYDGSLQGDTIVRRIFSLLGVKTSFTSQGQGADSAVILRRGKPVVSRLEFDFSNCPDLAQTVVCACIGLGVHFHFVGLKTLQIKETDRIKALKTELQKLGFLITDVDGSELKWDGERCEASMLPIDTYQDHRMAMAFAPLALKLQGMAINDPSVVSKSYPDFWNDLTHAGFAITE